MSSDYLVGIKKSLRKKYGDKLSVGKIASGSSWGFAEAGGFSYVMPVTVGGTAYTIEESISVNPYFASTRVSLKKDGKALFVSDHGSDFMNDFEIFMLSLNKNTDKTIKLEVVLPDEFSRGNVHYSNYEVIRYRGKNIGEDYETIGNFLDNLKLALGVDDLDKLKLELDIRHLTAQEEYDIIKSFGRA